MLASVFFLAGVLLLCGSGLALFFDHQGVGLQIMMAAYLLFVIGWLFYVFRRHEN